VLLAVLQHCDASSVTTVQPRQGRLKIARQELPGQQNDEGQSRQGRLIARIFSRPCRDSVVPVFLPGSSCRATFSRAYRRFPPTHVKIWAHSLFLRNLLTFLFKHLYEMARWLLRTLCLLGMISTRWGAQRSRGTIALRMRMSRLRIPKSI